VCCHSCSQHTVVVSRGSMMSIIQWSKLLNCAKSVVCGTEVWQLQTLHGAVYDTHLQRSNSGERRP
jgi:hypothetical protein